MLKKLKSLCEKLFTSFQDTKPQMFNVFREFDKIAEELMHAAEKFRNADELYDGNLVDGSLSNEKIEAGAMGDKPSEKSMLRKIWDGIYVGSGQVIGEIVEGFDSLDDTVTKENIKYAIGHPIETVSTAWNTVSDSFMNDFGMVMRKVVRNGEQVFLWDLAWAGLVIKE